MKLIPLALSGRLLIGSVLVAAGLIAASVGALVALPEHGAGLRSWIGAPLPGRDARVGFLRWWVTPIEKNAFARRIPTTASLNDLAAMGDGRTIFVVGDNGTLLESVNAGGTWRSLADNVKWRDATPPDDPDGPASETPTSLPALSSVAASPDGGRAIAVGESGTVLTSDDNGETWTECASGTSERLVSVAFDASTARAIAVGRRGTVRTSNEDGATWTERASGTSASLSGAKDWAGPRNLIHRDRRGGNGVRLQVRSGNLRRGGCGHRRAERQRSRRSIAVRPIAATGRLDGGSARAISRWPVVRECGRSRRGKAVSVSVRHSVADRSTIFGGR